MWNATKHEYFLIDFVCHWFKINYNINNLFFLAIPGVPIITLTDHTPKIVGQEINVTCTGLVGQPPEPFLWLRSKNSTIGFVEFTPTLPSQITNLAPIYDAINCQNTRTSVLTYLIEKDDHELKFKCKVFSTLESVPTTHEATVHIDTSGKIVQANAKQRLGRLCRRIYIYTYLW